MCAPGGTVANRRSCHCLAEAFRRIGLVEQTGRGIDKIFAGQLRYGRPAPDYGRTNSTAVRVVLRGGQPSLEFAAFVYEQDPAP